jgi:hypothetical protein
MLIDSGSKKNIIGLDTWNFLNTMKANVYEFTENNEIKFQSYANKVPLKVIGTFKTNIDVKKVKC